MTRRAIAPMYKNAKVVRGDTDNRWLVIVEQEGWGHEMVLATCGAATDANLLARLINRRYQQRSKVQRREAQDG